VSAPVVVTAPRPAVRVVTLSRPERLNALSLDLVEELHATLDELEGDGSCRVIVLTGAGRGFCSGLDLKELSATAPERPRGPAAGMAAQKRIADLVLRMRAIPQPVIAAVNGAAYGGGMALMLASDIRYASVSARLCTQFIRVGLSGCDIGVSYLLPKLVGAARAHELIMTARVVDAAEAAAMGLVARVVDDGELLHIALETADTLVGYSPFGLAMTKEVMWANLDAPSLAAAIHLENRTQILASTSGDIAEQVRSFVDR
jgi:enoyl-CoA hydratase